MKGLAFAVYTYGVIVRVAFSPSVIGPDSEPNIPSSQPVMYEHIIGFVLRKHPWIGSLDTHRE